MNLKSQLLKLLEDDHDSYSSGAKLAKSLSVSRNAVWKAMESLRAEGHNIIAVTNKGYRLEHGGDVLSEAGINKYLRSHDTFKIEVRKTVTSTNTILRDIAEQGAPEGYVIAAEEQTAGKGRQGRAFHSPAGHGAYFSVLLRPGSKTNEATFITAAAAVAAARAIEEVVGVRVGIKWVNDLFVGNKKVCGILTEAVFDMESGLVTSAVLGIGINITRPEDGFPDNIAEIATALTDRNAGSDNQRCRIIAATLDNFLGFYQNLSKREFLDEYRARSIVLGRDIYVISHNERTTATALEIDDNCGLIVRYENGELATLGSGDVSIRTM